MWIRTFGQGIQFILAISARFKPGSTQSIDTLFFAKRTVAFAVPPPTSSNRESTVNEETIKERPDLMGYGLSGIMTNEDWYYQVSNISDVFGLGMG